MLTQHDAVDTAARILPRFRTRNAINSTASTGSIVDLDVLLA